MAQNSPYNTHTIPLPAGDGYRYVITLNGTPVLTSGEFLMEPDAYRAGSRIAEDEASMTDFLRRAQEAQ